LSEDKGIFRGVSGDQWRNKGGVVSTKIFDLTPGGKTPYQPSPSIL